MSVIFKKNTIKKVFIILNIILFYSFSLNAQITPVDGLIIDKSGTHNGSFGNAGIYGIKFGGAGAGEGVASTKNTGTNINGLDFYTNYLQRLRILNNGNIGIGLYTSPTTRLSFGPYNSATDLPMRLSIFDNTVRFGLGYFEQGSPFRRVFSFHVSDPTQSRFGFFDDYSTSGINGYEFVTFNAANKSVGICNTNPDAMLQVSANPSDANASKKLAIFHASSSGFTNQYLTIGTGSQGLNNGYNFSLNMKKIVSGVTSDADLFLQSETASRSVGNVAIGAFVIGTPTSTTNVYPTPQSKLHIQLGNIQITNSDVPDKTKAGITMGAFGNRAAATTDYSWVQSSSGPLLLNPLSGNTLTTQTNNYVAIGLTKDAIVGTVGNGYNLLVAGKILCEELKIKLNSGATWYDHVLKPDYKLMTLDSLELFINKNSHLPDIPSEAEVKENGIMAGEMHGLLLKKVEELTLYMIDQNKNSEIQNAQNKIQTQAIADQAEQIKLLKEQNELLMQLIQKKTK